jgi:hypothetical protein
MEKCVADVKKSSPDVNAYAVCYDSLMGKGKGGSKKKAVKEVGSTFTLEPEMAQLYKEGEVGYCKKCKKNYPTMKPGAKCPECGTTLDISEKEINMSDVEQAVKEGLGFDEKAFAGHAGRPGKVGGSLPKGASAAAGAVKKVAKTALGTPKRMAETYKRNAQFVKRAGEVYAKTAAGTPKRMVEAGKLAGRAAGTYAKVASGTPKRMAETYKRNARLAGKLVRKAAQNAASGGLIGAAIRKARKKKELGDELYELSFGDKEVYEVSQDDLIDIMATLDEVATNLENLEFTEE